MAHSGSTEYVGILTRSIHSAVAARGLCSDYGGTEGADVVRAWSMGAPAGTNHRKRLAIPMSSPRRAGLPGDDRPST